MRIQLITAAVAVFSFACHKSETGVSPQPQGPQGPIALAQVTTGAVDNITPASASLWGSVTNKGGAAVTERGICWSKSPDTTTTQKVLAAMVTGAGDFKADIKGLEENTQYYVRSYAINKGGTAYGALISFSTIAANAPSVTTGSLSFIGGSFGTVAGTVTDTKGLAVLHRGICWSTAHNPTITGLVTDAGAGSGAFSGQLSGLSPATTYYVRAYATNERGATAYGNEVTLTTTAGNVSYTLVKSASPTAAEQDAYNRITAAMDSAVWYYNHYTTFSKKLTVSYVPGVATADGSNSGNIRFGSVTGYMEKTRAMHEIAHTMGVGTNASWSGRLIVSGVYQGTNANRVLRLITGVPTDEIHGDGAHFWPGGLNYVTEYKSTADLINHCKLLEAMKADGL